MINGNVIQFSVIGQMWTENGLCIPHLIFCVRMAIQIDSGLNQQRSVCVLVLLLT